LSHKWPFLDSSFIDKYAAYKLKLNIQKQGDIWRLWLLQCPDKKASTVLGTQMTSTYEDD